jgi:hypothetical protein
VSRVIAAVAADSAADAVLSTAIAVGGLFGAEVRALHIGTQRPAEGRAAVVRRMLAESPVPILLTPVRSVAQEEPVLASMSGADVAEGALS